MIGWRWLSWAALAAWALAAMPAQAKEEVVTIPTRAGVTISYLLATAEGSQPKICVVSFPGSLGAINLPERAKKPSLGLGPRANFLVRARTLIPDADFADVIIDAPSDKLPTGMDDAFRESADHVTDLRAVIADLRKRFPGTKIFLVGTSRGTISAAAAGAQLQKEIDGVILSSTVTHRDRVGPALSDFDFGTLKLPVLLVHHVDDGCPTSPYSGAQTLSKRFFLISVSGGNPPQSDRCDALAQHGYFGVEAPVVAAMKTWMSGGEPPHHVP